MSSVQSDIPRPGGDHWRLGRPPTPAQVIAHDGPWEFVSAAGREVIFMSADPSTYPGGWWRPVVYRDGASQHPLLFAARPWPTIIGDTRWDFPDGSWCTPHPAAEGMEWVPVEDDDPDEPLSHWRTGHARVYLDGQWNSGHSGLATGDTIAERTRSAFDALQAARSEELPATVRVDLTPAQMRRLAACGWDGGDEALAEWLVSRAEIVAVRGDCACTGEPPPDLAARCRAASEATVAAHIAETAARAAARWALEMLRKADYHECWVEWARPVDVNGLVIPAEELAERHRKQAAKFRDEARDSLAELEGGADSGARLLLQAFRDGRLVTSWDTGVGPVVVALHTADGQPQARGEVSQALADRIVRVLRAEEVTDAG